MNPWTLDLAAKVAARLRELPGRDRPPAIPIVITGEDITDPVEVWAHMLAALCWRYLHHQPREKPGEAEKRARAAFEALQRHGYGPYLRKGAADDAAVVERAHATRTTKAAIVNVLAMAYHDLTGKEPQRKNEPVSTAFLCLAAAVFDMAGLGVSHAVACKAVRVKAWLQA